MRLYLCGPVTRVPNLNRPAFELARQRLERVGYDVVVPHEFVPAHATHDHAMDLCFDRLSQGDIDGVALLDGWKHSKGSCMEVLHAEGLGIEVWPVKMWALGRQQKHAGQICQRRGRVDATGLRCGTPNDSKEKK